MKKIILAACLLSVGISCMIAPLNNQTFYWSDGGYVHRQFTFSGYMFEPNQTVTVQAFNQQTMVWEDIASAVSSNNHINPLSAPDLHSWQISAQISNNANPATWGRWTMDGSNPWVNPTQATATVRALMAGNPSPIYAYEEGFEQCIQDRQDDLGESFVDAAQACSSGHTATIQWIYDGP